MKRLLALTILAFACITAPASAYLNLNPAFYKVTVAVNDDFAFRTGNQPVVNYPSQCFSAQWQQLPNKGGCYDRRSDGEILFILHRSARGSTTSYPQAGYIVHVIGNNTSTYCVTNEDSRMFWSASIVHGLYFGKSC